MPSESKNLISVSLLSVLSFLAALTFSEPTQAAGKRPLPDEPSPALSDTFQPILPNPFDSAAPGESEPEFKDLIWNIQEGIAAHVEQALIVWKVERGLSETTMTRIATAEDAGNALMIRLDEKLELGLRQKVSQLALGLPSATPSPKDSCPHWIEIETVYGRRLYCNSPTEGKDARAAVEFVLQLNELMGTRPELRP
ncbi:MAG: hypothetical protein NDJ89_05600 [Oligoflexia bacterium]|nr:hypothetical protein [Oligoflexia bacterium]